MISPLLTALYSVQYFIYLAEGADQFFSVFAADFLKKIGYPAMQGFYGLPGGGGAGLGHRIPGIPTVGGVNLAQNQSVRFQLSERRAQIGARDALAPRYVFQAGAARGIQPDQDFQLRARILLEALVFAVPPQVIPQPVYNHNIFLYKIRKLPPQHNQNL
jgi:hypothetical protein